LKILFIQDTLINAGTENSLLQILPLVSADLEYKVVYFYSRHDLKIAYESAGIPMVFLDLKGKYDFWNGIKKLNNLIREENADLLVSSLLRSNLIARLVSFISGVPLVGTFVSDSYGDVVVRNKSFLDLQKFKFFWLLDRFTAPIPKLYISNSHFIAQSHVKTLGVPLEKNKVVYRGRKVPERIWKKPANAGFVFLAYGRLLQIKGFEELIQAFAKINRKYPTSRLVIYGEGNHRPILERLVNELELTGKVELPGVIPNVTVKLYEADCYVFPSWYEGFSGALVEAMMSGIPIIASDIPMNLEAIKPDENALVFPVRDIDKLTERMLQAIEQPSKMEQFGKAAREEAIRRFDIQVIAKQ